MEFDNDEIVLSTSLRGDGWAQHVPLIAGKKGQELRDAMAEVGLKENDNEFVQLTRYGELSDEELLKEFSRRFGPTT